jgi:hypothetical protein
MQLRICISGVPAMRHSSANNMRNDPRLAGAPKTSFQNQQVKEDREASENFGTSRGRLISCRR